MSHKMKANLSTLYQVTKEKEEKDQKRKKEHYI